MVKALYFTVRVWNRNSRKIVKSEFIDRLIFEDDDVAVVVDGSRWPQIRLLTLEVEDFCHISVEEDAGAQSDAFASAVSEGLDSAAVWLDRQSSELFEEVRAEGNIADVFVGGWIVSDQFDLELSVEFLAACSRLGLGISICTND